MPIVPVVVPVLCSTKHIRRVDVMRISQLESNGPNAVQLVRVLSEAADAGVELRQGSFHVVVRV